jgi:hypothetical protein
MPRIQLEVEFQGALIPNLTVSAIDLGDNRFQITGTYVLDGQERVVARGVHGLMTEVIEPKLRERYKVDPDVIFRVTDTDKNRLAVSAFHRNNEDDVVRLDRRNGGRRKTRRRKTYRQRRR